MVKAVIPAPETDAAICSGMVNSILKFIKVKFLKESTCNVRRAVCGRVGKLNSFWCSKVYSGIILNFRHNRFVFYGTFILKSYFALKPYFSYV